MFLNIGDQRLSLTVPFESQEFVRDVESKVDELYKKWRKSFSSKSDNEIMAMVAYQFASHYYEMQNSFESATKKAKECLTLLDS